MNTIDQLNTLTLQQLRALASQNKLQGWAAASRNELLRGLVKVSEDTQIDLLEGVRA
jgi:hypothetical protein